MNPKIFKQESIYVVLLKAIAPVLEHIAHESSKKQDELQDVLLACLQTAVFIIQGSRSYAPDEILDFYLPLLQKPHSIGEVVRDISVNANFMEDPSLNSTVFWSTMTTRERR